MRARLGIFFRIVVLLGVAATAVETTSLSRPSTDGVVNLPMDVATVKLPSTPGVIEDAPLRTFRVGRESRPARAVAGPQIVKHTVSVPPGGGRFETVVAPLKDAATVDVLVDGVPQGGPIAAKPNAWTPVLADLPADRASVTIEERLHTAKDSPVLWGDDRVAPNATTRQPDVIVITLDTTRWDYLTPYSPKETTTPTLAALAREGTRFDQAISVSSWTMPAHQAIMTGQFPDIDLGFGKRLEPVQVTLAEIFAAAGYTTHGASGGPYTDSTFGFQQGFRSYLDSGDWKNATSITNWAVERVTKAKRGAPLFMFLNYFNAHEPVGPVNVLEWGDLDSGKKALTPAMIASIRQGYRDELHRIDVQLARLFNAYRHSRDWNNTVVVIAADHGQFLGEHGYLGHSLSLDEELIRVPLIVKPASRSLGRPVYREQVQLTDAFDLTLHLAGLASGSGASMAAKIAAGEPIRDTAFAQIRMVPTPGLKAAARWRSALLTAIRTDSTKVIFDEEGRSTAVRISGGQECATSMSEHLPQLLLADLQRFLHDQPKASDTGSLKVSDEVRERLRALGYIR